MEEGPGNTPEAYEQYLQCVDRVQESVEVLERLLRRDRGILESAMGTLEAQFRHLLKTSRYGARSLTRPDFISFALLFAVYPLSQRNSRPPSSWTGFISLSSNILLVNVLFFLYYCTITVYPPTQRSSRPPCSRTLPRTTSGRRRWCWGLPSTSCTPSRGAWSPAGGAARAAGCTGARLAYCRPHTTVYFIVDVLVYFRTVLLSVHYYRHTKV